MKVSKGIANDKSSVRKALSIDDISNEPPFKKSVHKSATAYLTAVYKEMKRIVSEK